MSDLIAPVDDDVCVDPDRKARSPLSRLVVATLVALFGVLVGAPAVQAAICPPPAGAVSVQASFTQPLLGPAGRVYVGADVFDPATGTVSALTGDAAAGFVAYNPNSNLLFQAIRDQFGVHFRAFDASNHALVQTSGNVGTESFDPEYEVNPNSNRLFARVRRNNDAIDQWSVDTNTTMNVYSSPDFFRQEIRSFVYDAGRDLLIVALEGGQEGPEVFPPSIRVMSRSSSGQYSTQVTMLSDVDVLSLAHDPVGNKIYATLRDPDVFGQAGLATINAGTYAISMPSSYDAAIAEIDAVNFGNGRIWSLTRPALNSSSLGKLAEVDLATGQVVGSMSVENAGPPLWDSGRNRLYAAEADLLPSGSTAQLRWYVEGTCALDTSPPSVVVTSPADGSSVPAGSSVPLDFGCSDTGASGLRRCVAVALGGVWSDGDSVTAPSCECAFQIDFYATDWAGNVASATAFITTVATADADGDGVPDSLDVDVASPPNSVGFSDAASPAIGSGTYGVITPNGLTLVVEDDDPGTASSAVRISASGTGGPMQILPCGLPMTLFLDAGDTITIDCGSVTIDVEAGDGIIGTSGSSAIAIPSGVSATLDTSGQNLAVSNVSGGLVTVTVDLPSSDAVVTFPEGTGGTVNTSTGAITGVTGEGVTVTVAGVEVPVTGDVTFIQRGAGNHTINGTAGNDVIVDSGGHNTINGKGGDDLIISASGNDTIDGGAGNDTIKAGSGNNNVKGGDGNDHIETGNGNDTIDGGKGSDTCVAGLGKNSVKNCEG